MGSTTYQGSRKSFVRVTVYPSLGDGTYGDPIKLTGQYNDSTTPCVIAAHVSNALTQGASFSVTFKRAGANNPFDLFPVDSWVDISFGEDELSWHVLRGLVDELRVNTSASGGGATVQTYSLVGRSFQKIYSDMTAYFNPYLGDLLTSTEALRAVGDFVGDPKTILTAVFVDVLKSLTRNGRGLWAMPPAMPGVKQAIQGGSVATANTLLFVDAAQLNTDQYNRYFIPRTITTAHILEGNGSLWDLGQQFSDPALCELFTELLPDGTNLRSPSNVDTDGTQGLLESQSRMVTILRDRPFMVVDPAIGAGPLGSKSPYFDLPKMVVPYQHCVSIDVGRSGYERLNAFWLSNPDAASRSSAYPLYKQPLWDTADQKAHGLRRMDIPQIYNLLPLKKTDGVSRTVDSSNRAVKRLVRDFHCANAAFYSGSVALAEGMPWLRVGCRLAVRDQRNVLPDLNGYIEAITHTFSVANGTQSSVSFTRGFYGKELDMLKRLMAISARYVEPPVATPRNRP